MKCLLVLGCLVAAACAFSIDDVDRFNLVPITETKEYQEANPDSVLHGSQVPRRVGRVWGGQQAAPGDVAYQVGIVVLTSRQSFCGGSLVSVNFVLSAASCFPGNPNAIAEFGNADRTAVTEFINIAEKILYPQFVASNNIHDLALLRLVRPVTLTPTLQLVRIANRRQVEQEFLGQLARFSGWGTSGTGDSSPIRNLRVSTSPIISQNACRLRFPNSASSNTLCIDGTNTNVCNGDFGGPLTIRDADGITTQIGVASFVSPLGCTFGFPGGFTRISAYLSWIGENSDVVIRNGFD